MSKRLNVFFQMKGVTEIHILCAFHEHNIGNTKVLIIDNWNQSPRRHIGVFMTALFLKNCRQCKNWKFRDHFLIHFTRGKTKNLQKIKREKNIYILLVEKGIW